jgi:hypothetical protein
MEGTWTGVEGLVHVSFYDRGLYTTMSQVPAPTPLALLAAGAGLLLLARQRNRGVEGQRSVHLCLSSRAEDISRRDAKAQRKEEHENSLSSLCVSASLREIILLFLTLSSLTLSFLTLRALIITPAMRARRLRSQVILA